MHQAGTGAPSVLLIGVMYIPCLAIGAFSVMRNMKVFGWTIIVVGFVASVLLYGAVNNFLSPEHHLTYYVF